MVAGSETAIFDKLFWFTIHISEHASRSSFAIHISIGPSLCSNNSRCLRHCHRMLPIQTTPRSICLHLSLSLKYLSSLCQSQLMLHHSILLLPCNPLFWLRLTQRSPFDCFGVWECEVASGPTFGAGMQTCTVVKQSDWNLECGLLLLLLRSLQKILGQLCSLFLIFATFWWLACQSA